MGTEVIILFRIIKVLVGQCAHTNTYVICTTKGQWVASCCARWQDHKRDRLMRCSKKAFQTRPSVPYLELCAPLIGNLPVSSIRLMMRACLYTHSICFNNITTHMFVQSKWINITSQRPARLWCFALGFRSHTHTHKLWSSAQFGKQVDGFTTEVVYLFDPCRPCAVFIYKQP